MTFSLPRYVEPDFSSPPLAQAHPAVFKEAVLLRDTRMDCVVVLERDGALTVREFRRLKSGGLVACGRRENGEDGIFVHTGAFALPELNALLRFERTRGFILWVSGPAVVFDRDARSAFTALIERGYVHGLLAGNALGQEIYSRRLFSSGHYKHLDAINRVRSAGSISSAVESGAKKGGIMRGLVTHSIPYVLAGSIRDDGPLPGVVGDVYEAQDRMRDLTRRATTVVALATQLHSIAVGNMVPSYTVDMSEFAVTKLMNRGSLSARSILTNVQDFVVTVERGLKEERA